MYSIKMCSYVHQKMCTEMFTVAFVIVKTGNYLQNWKLPEDSSVVEIDCDMFSHHWNSKQ